MSRTFSLDRYRLLGRSGLRVSPLSLGTMTFGEQWGWGADADESRRIFDAYVDRGGNFIDTSVNYTNGGSERILGTLIKDCRERIVLATKFTMSRDADNINAGGNHRLNLIRSVETSLRQLDTDRIDLLYLHAWDFTTSPEEVMRGLDHLVQSGKVLYLGICNTPAWRVAQLQTLADLRGWSPLVALQIEYSLVERSVEHELLPMARALGLGVLPWSPLGGGILTGKYSRTALSDDNAAEVSTSRKGVIASTGHLNARSLEIADVVGTIADELGASRSQVALAWTLRHPAVVSPVMGARTLQQAEDNFGALEIVLSDEQLARLDQISALPPIFPQRFIGRPMAQQLIYGAHKVQLRS
ncbi:1-deoxyxylulose-5-phosphate synthase YajO [Xanthomonas hydrangeae]|uniref:aldo/keto reductase n=1 Tax=Xanthomonas hydrangeae TaxID=2775159 RepID=UPI00196666F3|nr:1-deoxyxylulose-5-phosphate synthase YajO [Xanthomonas hydrangeae]CAD7714029.1 1-deoxyxylulose-5-phosphate synthase YajO [Xanthomonas hydrangeae]CAD7722136.1 1-deoxyxylulose-5-phosphate synthase YajO [Xanthomonas hydrangeae]CAD7722140.1 1-deoxyxylulose-5-phosphate synthase YajO [Xanthomonas hydrangeae]